MVPINWRVLLPREFKKTLGHVPNDPSIFAHFRRYQQTPIYSPIKVLGKINFEGAFLYHLRGGLPEQLKTLLMHVAGVTRQNAPLTIFWSFSKSPESRSSNSTKPSRTPQMGCLSDWYAVSRTKFWGGAKYLSICENELKVVGAILGRDFC